MYCRNRMTLEKKKLTATPARSIGGRRGPLPAAGGQQIDQRRSRARRLRRRENATLGRPNSENVQLERMQTAAPSEAPLETPRVNGRGQRIAEHRLKDHPAGGQGRARQERLEHPRDAQVPGCRPSFMAPSASDTSPQSAGRGIRSRPKNGAAASTATASTRKATIVHSGAISSFRGPSLATWPAPYPARASSWVRSSAGRPADDRPAVKRGAVDSLRARRAS